MKFVFCLFSISFDRVEVADHEYLLFSLSKFFLPIENYEILKWYRFCQKMHLFQKPVKFFISFLFPSLKIIFANSASQTESEKFLESTLDPKLWWRWRSESHRVYHKQVDFVDLSSFLRQLMEQNILSHSTDHTSSHKVTYPFYSFCFLCGEKSFLLEPDLC